MFSKQVDPVYLPVIHMGAACAGEVVSQNREIVIKIFSASKDMFRIIFMSSLKINLSISSF
jgi:hypothetical protein